MPLEERYYVAHSEILTGGVCVPFFVCVRALNRRNKYTLGKGRRHPLLVGLNVGLYFLTIVTSLDENDPGHVGEAKISVLNYFSKEKCTFGYMKHTHTKNAKSPNKNCVMWNCHGNCLYGKCKHRRVAHRVTCRTGVERNSKNVTKFVFIYILSLSNNANKLC